MKKKQLQVVSKRRPDNPRERLRARDRDARERNRLRLLNDDARKDYRARAMQREATFLVDPLKLAETVVEKLRASRLDDALALVRASEKSREGMPVDNIVSWNHIIDYLMSKDSPNMAWKVYNEVQSLHWFVKIPVNRAPFTDEKARP